MPELALLFNHGDALDIGIENSGSEKAESSR